MFFAMDSSKRIDYVLVYGRNNDGDEIRKEFEAGLVVTGIELEREDIEVIAVVIIIIIIFHYARRQQ